MLMPSGDGLLDGRDAFRRRRDLDHHVRAARACVNSRFASATVFAVSLREQRRDFEADVAVVAVGLVVDGRKTSAALPMSSIDELVVDLVARLALRRQHRATARRNPRCRRWPSRRWSDWTSARAGRPRRSSSAACPVETSLRSIWSYQTLCPSFGELREGIGHGDASVQWVSIFESRVARVSECSSARVALSLRTQAQHSRLPRPLADGLRGDAGDEDADERRRRRR